MSERQSSEMDDLDAWPHPPILREHWPAVRTLLGQDEWAVLRRRLVEMLPDGPLLEPRDVFPAPARN